MQKKRRLGSHRDASLASGGGGNLRLWLRLRLRLRIVLLVIDVLRRRVLFVVDLLLFGGRQCPAVGPAVRGNLLVDALLLVLGFGCFAGRHLAALDALGDTVLLIFAALVHFVVSIVLRAGVVLVLVDLLGHLILLPVDLFLLRRRQLAAVGRAVRFGLAVDGRFFRFQVSGFTGRQLAALHPLRDAILLIFFALGDCGLRLLCRSWRCRGGCWRRRTCALCLRRRLRARSRLILRHCHTAGQ